MNARQAERVRSYLRGRLQLAILPTNTPSGGWITAALDKTESTSELYPTLEDLARRFNVTIPNSIMGE